MSGQLYNLIMASVPSFYSGYEGEFNIPVSRFLEYTEAPIKEQFQLLGQDAINRLKSLPTIFAVEDEVADAKIGKITDIKVNSNNLRVKYRFDKDYYPLTRGVLKEYQQKLGIDKFEFHRGHWAVKECDISNFYEDYLKSLTGIAHKLKNTDKKVHLIYAFNGTGKTRLSLELKKLISPKTVDDVDDFDSVESFDDIGNTRSKFLYYNAFTEDLFYWDNDLIGDAEPKLKIQPNTFVDWIIGERGAEPNIVKSFQLYVNDKLTPTFKEEDVVKEGRKTGEKIYPEVSFSLDTGTERTGNIKISKGEESNFIWSIFYTLLQEVVSILDQPDASKRDDSQFDQLKYVFIDDPVSSLDDNHLIELAVSLAFLIKKSAYKNGQGIKFVITTHSPLFYNVLWNEFNNDLYKNKSDGSFKGNNVDDEEQYERVYQRGQSERHRLIKKADGTFELKNSNDHPFSYHLFLLSELKKAIKGNNIEKYHFSFARNLMEKTATFLGYKRWENLLEKAADGHQDFVANRLLNLSSHSAHAGEEAADITDEDKEKLGKLVTFLIETYGFRPEEEANA